MNIKRPKYTEFICPNCKCHENIPTDIVLQMDMMDPGDPIVFDKLKVDQKITIL